MDRVAPRPEQETSGEQSLRGGNKGATRLRLSEDSGVFVLCKGV